MNLDGFTKTTETVGKISNTPLDRRLFLKIFGASALAITTGIGCASVGHRPAPAVSTTFDTKGFAHAGRIYEALGGPEYENQPTSIFMKNLATGYESFIEINSSNKNIKIYTISREGYLVEAIFKENPDKTLNFESGNADKGRIPLLSDKAPEVRDAGRIVAEAMQLLWQYQPTAGVKSDVVGGIKALASLTSQDGSVTRIDTYPIQQIAYDPYFRGRINYNQQQRLSITRSFKDYFLNGAVIIGQELNLGGSYDFTYMANQLALNLHKSMPKFDGFSLKEKGFLAETILHTTLKETFMLLNEMGVSSHRLPRISRVPTNPQYQMEDFFGSPSKKLGKLLDKKVLYKALASLPTIVFDEETCEDKQYKEGEGMKVFYTPTGVEYCDLTQYKYDKNNAEPVGIVGRLSRVAARFGLSLV